MLKMNEFFKQKSLYTIQSGTKIIDAVNYMSEHNVGLIPVLDNEKLIGVFSERDLMRRVIAKGLDLSLTKVDEIMTKELILAKSDESYEVCLMKMKEAKIRHILVIENEKLLGVLSMRDLLEIDISAKKETIEVLNNYIYSR
jgi:CBS domain-containing protein